jgi:hypothetical protein
MLPYQGCGRRRPAQPFDAPQDFDKKRLRQRHLVQLRHDSRNGRSPLHRSPDRAYNVAQVLGIELRG